MFTKKSFTEMSCFPFQSSVPLITWSIPVVWTELAESWAKVFVNTDITPAIARMAIIIRAIFLFFSAFETGILFLAP